MTNNVETTFIDALSMFGDIAKIVRITPRSEYKVKVNRFSRRKVKWIKKYIGIRCLLIREKAFKIKLKVVVVRKVKVDRTDKYCKVIMEVREKGDAEYRTQREKEQIGYKLKQSLHMRVDLFVKEVVPAKVKFLWKMDILDFDKLYEDMKRIFESYFSFDFSQTIAPTEPLR